MNYWAFLASAPCLDGIEIMIEGQVVLHFIFRPNMHLKRRNDLEHCDFELLFVEVNSLLFVCGVCYRPPNYNSAQNIALLAHLQFCFDEINQIPSTFVLLFGDFNANFIVENSLPNDDFGSCLFRLMACNSLFQVINEPTCITEHMQHY